MAKRFAHVCIGILCLMAAYQLGTSAAFSSPVGSGVSAMDHNGWVLDEVGQVWNVGAVEARSWHRAAVHDPPMPLSQIAFWGAHAIVTTDGNGWYNDGGGWVDCGLYPGGPVSLDAQSWGKTKSNFR